MTERIEAPDVTTVRDGRQVVVRPLEEGDHAALLDFGLALPTDDWRYLEDDLQSPDIILRLINAHAAENWRQIVAVTDDGTIAAYSSVRRLPSWSSHVGVIRLIVAEPWRRCGLGAIVGRAIFEASRDLGLQKMMVEMLAEQKTGQEIFERLGFSVEGVFSQHCRDPLGELHDLLILSYFM